MASADDGIRSRRRFGGFLDRTLPSVLNLPRVAEIEFLELTASRRR
jgi:hypothetical protein